ncbi:fatty acid desaturase [Viridibacterium curvum]|uniref:Fatty acid desaturase n=1 Tax=Viridibacterium curvum TaxID=1101404 RepID=A0ABP9QTG9_9RHOO
MPTTASLKANKREIIASHVRPDNRKAFVQICTTLLPLAVLWWGIAQSASVSYWLTAGLVILLILFMLRSFVLMHECGHGSLFRGARLNRAVGFVFGVVTGMPQFVWSQHHQYHHANNGNWERYTGPLAIISTDEFAAMSPTQQRQYCRARSVWLAPLAGFIYLLVNPRRSCLRGILALFRHARSRRIEQPDLSWSASGEGFSMPCGASAQEFRHMLANNLAWLALWLAMAWLVGPALFLVCAVLSISMAGGIGIMLFTVQHNFEHAYATGDEGWDYDQAALEGTSFLLLPGWLNWFTANIAYHHIHHMSARIPNYCLAACHGEYEALFAGVPRIRLSDVPAALRCILWDKQQRRITSVAAYQQQRAVAAC